MEVTDFAGIDLGKLGVQVRRRWWGLINLLLQNDFALLQAVQLFLQAGRA